MEHRDRQHALVAAPPRKRACVARAALRRAVGPLCGERLFGSAQRVRRPSPPGPGLKLLGALLQAPSSYGGPPRDIAALVFRRFNVSESGELSLQELQALQVLSRTRP